MQKNTRYTPVAEREHGLVEFLPATTQNAARNSSLTDAELVSVGSVAKATARDMGYAGAAYALEVVNIQNKVLARAKRGDVRIYKSDKPYPWCLDDLEDFHSGLRLRITDAEMIRRQVLGHATPANDSATATEAGPVGQMVAEPEPMQTAPDTQAAQVPPVVESPEQRRARWLDWRGNGERGSLQRVYERELLQNPKADRSFIGKEIKKAKTERAEKNRAGVMFGQLVQDGKRTG